jgi:glycosyltransferase involved in cell wall biosynthesis
MSGGPGSFVAKFTAGARARGVDVTFDLHDPHLSAALVISGSRDLPRLFALRRRGVPVVQRLDGINWIYRKNPVSLKHSLRSQYSNLLLSSIRRFVASGIVYQSEFSHRWWDDWYGALNKPHTVIHNGVDLQTYAPQAGRVPETGKIRLLVVEGSMGGGYEGGLTNAVQLAHALATRISTPLELVIVGAVPAALQTHWTQKSTIPITWMGTVAQNQIPAILTSAHALFSADVHPACPNSVIEALACGVPVVAYDTGSLTELVTPQAGAIVPYGSNPWDLDAPDVEGLATATVRVLEHNPEFRRGARLRAESALGLDTMVTRYLDALNLT